MSEAPPSEEVEREIERDVIRSFGSSIIEFEAVLFQKFLIFSGPRSVLTEGMFRKHLTRMHSKGYISPLDFQGRRSWKKLVVEEEIEEERQSPDDIEDVLRLSLSIPPESKRSAPLPKEKLVSESSIIADNLRQTILDRLPEEGQIDSRKQIQLNELIKGMRRALSVSRRGFLQYVINNVPNLRVPMVEILDSKGEEVLLLSLRILETN
ncbi:MAG: hypothetical protein ACXAEB_03755 [Candidatus Thorarchaeota archaeon]|jgi:hypothetical protein